MAQKRFSYGCCVGGFDTRDIAWLAVEGHTNRFGFAIFENRKVSQGNANFFGSGYVRNLPDKLIILHQ